MQEGGGLDSLAIAWQYPGHALEVIPARFSMMTRPNPATTTNSTSTDMIEQPVDSNTTSAVPDTAVLQPTTIYDAGEAAPQFSILMAFVDAAGLTDLVSGSGPITVLGPCEIFVTVTFRFTPNLIGSLTFFTHSHDR
jgi:hypothetical protein